MDGRTLQHVRDSLLARWQKIVDDRQSEQPIVDSYSQPSEMIDIAQSLEQMGRDTSLQEVERKELLAIEKALAKMATGNYGICEECSEEIPPKRLMVLPEARLCANCQTYEERYQSRTRISGVNPR